MMEAAENTQKLLAMRTAMFMVNAPMMITGGTFAMSASTTSPPRQVLAELFERHVSFSATHDTIEDHNPPCCDPDSHRLLLERLIAWTDDPGSQPILWIVGPKRSGKTSIAGTFAEILQRHDKLGATFFLNEKHRRSSETFLFPTIAFQLSESIPALQPHLVEVLQDSRFLFQKSLSTQIEQLIVRPILSLGQVDPSFQRVIIIDGLDSQHAPGSAFRVLGAIHEVARLSGRVRFCILSRPEKTLAPLHLTMSRLALCINLEIPSCSEQTHASNKSKKPRKTNPTADNDTLLLAVPTPTVQPTNSSPNNNNSSQSPSAVSPMGYTANAEISAQTFYLPAIPPPEEYCVDCAMRDQDMTDVDVTSPNAWGRESDALFEEFKTRQLEEEEVEATGTAAAANDNSAMSRSRINGVLQLTEQNIQLLLIANSSFEPSALVRWHILHGYLDSQWKLLQAEGAVPDVSIIAQQLEQDEAVVNDPNTSLGSELLPADHTEAEQAPPAHESIGRPQSQICSHCHRNMLQLPESELDASRSDSDSKTRNDTNHDLQEQTSSPIPEMQLTSYSTSISEQLMKFLTAPLDHFFSAWTSLFVHQWP